MNGPSLPNPNAQGGNDSGKAAALQNARLVGGQQPTGPENMPRQGASGAGPAVTVADHLAEAFALLVRNGGQPQDMEALQQFFVSLEGLAGSAGGAQPQQPPGPVAPQGQPAQAGPPMQAGMMAAGAPQGPMR